MTKKFAVILVKNGDIISINLKKKEVNLEISKNEMEKRIKKWKMNKQIHQ